MKFGTSVGQLRIEFFDTARYAVDWTCPVLIPHPVLIQADFRSNLTGDSPPIAECLRRVL